MTDTSKREELIRAVQAVTWNASNYPPKIQPHVLGQDIVPLTMKIVDAVEAVFEQAHTPSGDEREAARAYADAEYPDLLLAPENEDKADIAERAFLAGARFRCTAVSTDDEREAIIDALLDELGWEWDEVPEEHIPSSREILGDMADRVLAVVAGFRRTVQGEPTDALRRYLRTKGFNTSRMGNWGTDSGIGLAQDAFLAGWAARERGA